MISNAAAGVHILTVKLIDASGEEWESDPATVRVIAVSEFPAIPAPPPVLLNPALAGGNVSFSMQTEAGVICQLEYTESLNSANWKVLRTVVGDGSIMTVTDALTQAPQRFYRVRMQ